jgi:sulfoxide reductase heme-binding subunit YedZ
VIHLTNSSVDWYAARAAGIVAYLLLTCVVAVGVSMAGRVTPARWPRFAIEDVHRFGGILVGVFLAIHIATIAIDSYLPFTITQLFVPLTDSYRPLWVALGIVAAELLVALAIANRLRSRMPYRWWRRSHYLTLAVWLGATAHGIGSGTDRGAAWMIAIYAGSIGLVSALFLIRIGRRSWWPAALAAGALPLLIVQFALGGGSRPWNPRSFSDAISGRIVEQDGGSGAIVSMTGSGRGDEPVLLRVDLLLLSGQSQNTSFQLEYLRSGDICSGSVTSAQSYGFSGKCRLPDGSMRTVTARWKLLSGSHLAGRLVAGPTLAEQST